MGYTEQRIIIPYSPRPLQLSIHESLKRFNVLVCHRRFGKSVLSINQLIKVALSCDLPNPRCAYIAPLFAQAKTVAWDYLKHYTSVIPGVVKNEAELRVDLPNGARISLYGADNPDRLRGLYHDCVVLDEYADMSPRMWAEVIRPALSDRHGQAIFIGTPKGRNQFWEIYEQARKDEKWYSALYRASETNIISPEELADARASMSEEQYAQEFECSFQAALIGAYYSREIADLEAEGRVTKVSYDKLLPVYTAWDLGMDDSTAIWFAQLAGTEIRIIDYYENSGCGLDHYVRVLKEKPYIYKEHYLPHDTRVRELGSGRSRVETLESLGLSPTVLDASSVEDGINAVRLILPRCWFDEDKTAPGLEALRQYQREFDDKTRTFKNRPRHDWTSHASDGFRQLAMAIPDGIKAYKRKINKPNSWMSA
ncbi:MAG: hypothetical protein KGL39_24305 [Patescibacteria group bacterium]|nr:hypothetical protein [Patescibacteria group bacterium]